MRHTMLDLETLGTRPGSVIRSIAAVEFEFNGKIGETFYRNIDLRSCEDAGLIIDPDTAAWWSQQSKEAQKQLLVDQQKLVDVVLAFGRWFNHDAYLWAHGAAFDPVLWQAATEAVGEGIPWKFWNVRDTRTVFDLRRFDPRDISRDTLPHSALDDARWQIECLWAATRNVDVMA